MDTVHTGKSRFRYIFLVDGRLSPLLLMPLQSFQTQTDISKLLGSDDRVGVWMVIIVPVEQEQGNYRRNNPEMIDEIEET
jgi:hypothetical protein